MNQCTDRELFQTVRVSPGPAHASLSNNVPQDSFGLPVFIAISIGPDLSMVYDSRGSGRGIHLSWVSLFVPGSTAPALRLG